MMLNLFGDALHLGATKAVHLAQHRRPMWAVQIENRLASGTYDMHMRRPMVIEIDAKAQAVQVQDRGHVPS